MNRFLLIFMAIVLISGLVFTSCAKSAPATTPAVTTTPAMTTAKTAPAPTSAAPTTAKTSPAPTSAAPTTAPQYGGVLKIINAPGILNMGVPGESGTPNDGMCASPAVENLVSLDNQGNVIPLLATAWKISPDYKSITFTLRQGVKFHDGTDLNAEAAKYCLDLVRVSKFRTDLRSVASIDVIDNYTVRLNLSTYEPALLSALNTGRGGEMFSPTALKAMGKDALLHPVGTGPFKFVSYKTDVSVKYERFDGYWQKGKPYLDGIEFILIQDLTTSMASFKAGEAQILRSVDPSSAADLQPTGKYKIATTPASVNGFISDYGHAGSPFADIRVRQAVAYAIDNNAIAKSVGYGFYEPANQFVGTRAWYYNPAVKGYPYNPDKAKQLLSEAGYGNGFQTKVTYQTSNTNQDVYTAVQGYLSKVGIDMKMEPVSAALITETRAKGWNNSIVSFDVSYAIGFDPVTPLTSRISSKGTRYNLTTINIPTDYDTLLAEATVEPDTEKRKAMCQEMMRLIIDKHCMANPLYVGNSLISYSINVHDLNMNESASHIWYPANVWLSK